MQRQQPINSFPQAYMSPASQRHSLNQLLKQSASSCTTVLPPPNMPEASRHMNYKPNTSGARQQRMGFMLQQHQPVQRATVQKTHSVLRSNPPPQYGAQLPKQPTPQSRQYLLVSHPPPKSHAGNSGQLLAGSPSVSSDRQRQGQIQLGQTYRFNVERSPRFTNPGGIVFQHNQSSGSHGQRIPLSANDKGKFIPFSRLLPPGQSINTNAKMDAHSSRVQTILSQPCPTTIISPQAVAAPRQHSASFLTSSSPALQLHGYMNKPAFSMTSTKVERGAFRLGPAKVTDVKTEVKSPAPQRLPAMVKREPFDWDEYLKLTGSKAAPHTSFKHVEISLHNGFNSGMKLEVANKADPTTYWVATLISTCGQLLLLRYDGCGDDRKTDFWVDVCTADVHPIGWCAQNGKILQPPESIRNLHEDWANFLVKNLIGARTAPERLLSGPFKGKTVVELIEAKMLLEVQDSQHPQHVWMADVLKNVGGRLLLRYKGLSDSDSKFDFWLFYLDVRLHQVGWGKEHHLTMKPPDSIRHKYNSKEHWAYVLSVSLKGVTEQDLVPACVFYDQLKLRPHELKQLLKLAVLDPINPTKIRPATVVKIVNKFFFLAELDDFSQTSTCAFLCHSGSSGIFSINWCRKHNILITPPRGYDVQNFSWDEYLRFTCSQAAPDSCFSYMSEKHEFQEGMKLEACSPFNLYEICVATIVKAYGNVLHLRLAATDPDTNTQSQPDKFVDCFVHSSSQDIFPVGWCDSNNYPLSAPLNWQKRSQVQDGIFKNFPNKKVAVVQPEVHVHREQSLANSQEMRSVINPSSNSKLWCPVVCFNCTCKSGMFMNDHALSKVPKFVGPGNTALVVREVLSLLVGAAERPHKLLKDLEDFTVGRGNQPCVIKAKFEGKKYQATLHIVDSASQVPEYFGALARFLKCCPNLLTLENPVTKCPLNCMRERPVGRPPSLKHMHAQRGRKRKLIMNGVKPNTITALSRPAVRGGIKSVTRGSAGYRMIRQTFFENGTHEYDDSSAVASLLPNACDRLKRSMECLVKCDHSTINKKIRRQQEAMKLHRLKLQSNPLNWTVEDVVEFIQSTDCAEFSRMFTQQQIDGQALLLLTLPVIQEFMELKLGPALKLSRHIERVKMAFYENFAAT